MSSGSKETVDMPSKTAIILEMDLDGDFNFAPSISSAIAMAGDELAELDETIRSIEALKPACDKLDYALAASSGAICGLIDIFLVGKPGESPIGDISDGWFRARITDFAKINGWQDGSAKTPIRFLEEKYKIPYDQTGRGIAADIYGLTPSNHHFKSLGHNPSLLGLFFSILDQFQDRSHFVTEGQLVALEEADGSFELRGNSVPAKLFCGFANWFGHLISDMSGSSQSKGRGMGIPSPLWTWTNDVIVIGQSLGIPASSFSKRANELALEIYKQGYDARFQAAQAIPVVVNELIVRLLYSARRMIRYLAGTRGQARPLPETWSSCEPFTNPTVKRMLTIAHGTFCALDIGDATARSFAAGGGMFNAPEFFVRLNIVGVGRFAVSLYGEGQRAMALHSAKEQARFALREKAIVEDYLDGLNQLAKLYDDEHLVRFVDSLKDSDAYIRAFEDSVRLAKLRNVPKEKRLADKTDIDKYFEGGQK